MDKTFSVQDNDEKPGSKVKQKGLKVMTDHTYQPLKTIGQTLYLSKKISGMSQGMSQTQKSIGSLVQVTESEDEEMSSKMKIRIDNQTKPSK